MNFLFGKLTWDALPYEWFTIGGSVFIIIMCAGIALLVTRLKRWKWLWNNWLTSTDPKKVGIMYIIFASVMLFRGGLDAGMIWLQMAIKGFKTHDNKVWGKNMFLFSLVVLLVFCVMISVGSILP